MSYSSWLSTNSMIKIRDKKFRNILFIIKILINNDITLYYPP